MLGKRIKEIRKECGFTQEKLAELVGIDITTLSGIESGRHFPSLANLEKIAETLHVSMSILFDFNQNVPVEDMKKAISENLHLLSESDIKFIYRFIDKQYFES